jgi:hypothetical protein
VDSSTAQAIVDAMPASGGVLDIPAGTHSWLTPVVLKTGVRVRGDGRSATVVIGNRGCFTWTADLSQVHIEHLTLSAGGGHVMASTQGDYGIYTTTIRHCNLYQNDPNYCIMYHVSARDYDNVDVADCDLSRPAGSMLPGWYVVNSGGGANENRWRGCWAHSNNTASSPMFWIESTNPQTYAYDNHFEDITGEQNLGGIIRALSTANLIVDNVMDYDALGSYMDDLIYVGKSVSGGLRSLFPTVRNSGRRGGSLAAGVFDINFPPGSVASGLIESPNHSSVAAVLNVDPGTTVINALAMPAVFPDGVRAGAAQITSGRGAPDGGVQGSVGDIYLRTDGGLSSTLYVKESGIATNTGWVAK